MKKIVLPILNFTLSLAVSMLLVSNSFAMRCGDRIIAKGDRLYTVLKACGKPSAITHTFKDNTFVIERSNAKNSQRTQKSNHKTIDHLVYDFGENTFVYYLDFENNQLVSIEAHRNT